MERARAHVMPGRIAQAVEQFAASAGRSARERGISDAAARRHDRPAHRKPVTCARGARGSRADAAALLRVPGAVMRVREFSNLVDLARASVDEYASRPLFGEKRDGAWHWMTYADWQKRIDALRAGMAELGIEPGDRIAIVSRNSAAWATIAYAALGLGAAFVPMYEMQRPEDWEFILRDCGATVVFGRTPAIASTLEAMRPRLPALRHVVTIEGSATDPHSMLALEQQQRTRAVPPVRIGPDEVAVLVYTSGTTGKPKGAMLTHHNLTANVAGTVAGFPITRAERTLSFLPWAHIYGQMAELHMLVAVGASTAFNTSIEHLLHELREVKPTVLVAVPRIFNKIHAGVSAQIEHRPRVIRDVFWSGIAASIKRRRGQRLSPREWVSYLLASIVFATIRRKLGGRLKY